MPGSQDLRRSQIKQCIEWYEKYLVDYPLEDVSHLDERIQLAFKSGRIAKNGKAKLAEKASVCPHCSAVYASEKSVEIHIKGKQGKNPKKPTCPYSSQLPFLPLLPHGQSLKIRL